MTRRTVTASQLETAMTDTSLPATLPAVVESDTQRLAWRRAVQEAKDERGLIDMQIDSLRRTADHQREEADRICMARVSAANAARDRENADTAKVEEAGVSALQIRQADIDRLLAGYEAALGASE